MIKFTCPHCKKSLGVPDNLAGKNERCPVCKKPLTIPAAVPVPTDVEDLAAKAFADQPVAAAPVKQPTTIEFPCPMCDEKMTVSAELGGKQAPCPHCRRIVKVPMPVKQEQKDWRAAETRLPSGARREEQPALDG